MNLPQLKKLARQYRLPLIQDGRAMQLACGRIVAWDDGDGLLAFTTSCLCDASWAIRQHGRIVFSTSHGITVVFSATRLFEIIDVALSAPPKPITPATGLLATA